MKSASSQSLISSRSWSPNAMSSGKTSTAVLLSPSRGASATNKSTTKANSAVQVSGQTNPNSNGNLLTSISSRGQQEIVVFSSASVKDPAFAINEIRALVTASANYDLVSADEIAAQKTREEIIALREEIVQIIPELGSEHPKTLGLYSKLGMIFSSAGYLAEAERLITRAWNGRKNAHGVRHINVFLEQTNLANVLYKLRRYKEARDLFTSALEGMEDLIGKQNDTVLEPIAGLGRTCHALGLLSEAESYFNRIYLYHCGVSGPEAEISLKAGNQLASIYKDEAFFLLADQLCSQVLRHATTLLGEQHPITQDSVEILARIRVGEGKNEEAEEMYRRALEYQEGMFGFDGGPTIRTVISIAKLQWDRHFIEGAELMYKRALDSLLRTEGPLHESTLTVLQSLGLMLYEIERIRESESLLRRSYSGRKATLGILNELTLNASLSLANALNVTAEWKHEPDYPQKLLESEELTRQCVSGRAKMFGPTSVVCMEARFILADFLLEHRRYTESEVEYRTIFTFYEQFAGIEDVTTARAAYGLGVSLQYQRVYGDAFPYFEIAQNAFVKAWGNESGHGSLIHRHRRAIADASEMYRYTKTRAKQSEYDPTLRGSVYSGR